MHRFLLSIAALAGILAAPASAQRVTVDPDWALRRWWSETGLPQNSVNALAQTQDGFLWIGTFGGLARFDGVDFEVYDVSNAPALGSARVLSLLSSSDGSLWVGLQLGGLARRVEGEFETVDLPPIGEIWSLAEGPDGSIWVGATGGAFRVDPDGGITTVPLPTDQNAVEIARVGAHVVVGRSDRLRLFRDGSVNDFEDIPIQGNARALLEDGPGLWVGTSQGLGRIDDLADPDFRVVPGVEGVIQDLAASGPTLLAIGFTLYTVDRADESVTSIEIDFPEAIFNRFSALFVDRERSFWVGSRGNGLVQLRPATVRAVDPSLGVREVYAMRAMPDSTVWISICPDLHIYDARSDPPVRRGGRPGDPCLDHVTIPGPDGRVYARGTFNRVEIWLDSTGAVLETGETGISWARSQPDGVPLRAVPARGLERLQADGTWAPVPGGDIPQLGNPTPLPSGIWAGFPGGVVRIRDGEARVWGEGSGVARGEKRWIHEDVNGDVWIAAYGGGLTRIRGEDVFTFGPEQGLPETFFSSIAEEGGALWIVGNQTLSRVPLQQLDAVVSGEASRVYPAVFRQRDGFREASGPDLAVDPMGRIWFGTIEGPRVVDPANRPRNEVAPPAVVVEVRVDGEIVDPAVPLPPHPGEVEVRYTSPTFVRPETVRFRYRLVGLSNEWIDAGTRRSAFFTNLPPREFQFEVIAINDEGIEAPSAGTIQLTVQPSILQTWWFRAGTLLAIALGIWALVSLMTRVERRRNYVLTQEMQERQRLEKERQDLSQQLLRAQKLEAIGRLTGGIAHDFNNLLLVVTASLEMARDAGDSQERLDAVDTAMSAAFRGGALTRQLLAFSRQGEVRPRPLQIEDVVAEMDQMLARSLGDRHPVEVDVPAGLWTVFSDSDGLQNAVLNLAINARDAMPDGGPIRVEARNVGSDELPSDRPVATRVDHVRISVTDQGTGIAKGDLERIFDPFFTTKEVGKGTGLGLSMVHGFAGQAGGFVDIDTKLGRGTTVSIFLPRIEGTIEEPAPTEQEPIVLGSGELVYLVEDNDRVRFVTRRLLEELGYSVEEFEAAEAAEARIRDGAAPDLVLSDIMLPGKTGVELAIELRATHPTLPVLLATGYAPEGLTDAVADFVVLEKPYTAATLASAIRDLLGGARR